MNIKPLLICCKLLILAAAIQTTVSCEDPIVNEREANISWKSKDDFSGLSKIKVSSFSTGDKIFFYGPLYFSHFGEDYTITHSATELDYPSFYNLPVSTNYFVEASVETIRFASTTYPVSHSKSAFILMENVASDFQGFFFGQKFQIGAIDINEAGQCLLPIVSNNVEKDIILYLFNISSEESEISVNDTTRINIGNPSPLKYYKIFFSKGIKDYFMVSVEDGLYKIYHDGTFKKVLDETFVNIFRFEDKIFCLREFNAIGISDNEGETWNFMEGYNPSLVYSKYYTIKDSLIVANKSDLFTLKFTTNSYTLRPLNNIGIESNEITSLAEYKDSVYVSTYSGVFVKSLNDFFKSKD